MNSQEKREKALWKLFLYWKLSHDESEEEPFFSVMYILVFFVDKKSPLGRRVLLYIAILTCFDMKINIIVIAVNG